MKRDKIFNTNRVQEDFVFNERVAEVFDDMLNRSIPFYDTVIESIISLFKQMIPHGSTVYDLGCSTGSTLLKLASRLSDMNLRFIGVDNSPAMIDKARLKADMFTKSENVLFQECDISKFNLEGAGGIICNYTLQFIRPMLRPEFIKRLYNALCEGGVLIISEKVISHDSRLNREFIEIYHQFKRDRGYSELEIASKREALENVLIPFSIQENKDLLHQAGFISIETFFQWFNFSSFITIK